jgi:SAM-dependent methyltransferase
MSGTELSPGARGCPVCGSRDYSIYLARVYALPGASLPVGGMQTGAEAGLVSGGAEEASGQESGQVFDLVKCSGCGLVYVHPMPSLETVCSLYSEKYFYSDFSCGIRKGTYLETEGSRVEEYRETLTQIQVFKGSGRFLEVGCAAGSFLNYAQRAGFEVEGVDISEWAASTAREQFGLKVHQGRLVETGLPGKSFDVVFLGDLLEHEPDPAGFLGEVHCILKDDGVAVIKVPVYVNSFYYRIARRMPWSWTMGRLDARLLHSLKVSGDAPAFPPYHLYEYSPRTLEMLLDKMGFRILRRQSSILIPEFLREPDASWPERVALVGFVFLRLIIRTLNIHGGHITVFAEKAESSPRLERPVDGEDG